MPSTLSPKRAQLGVSLMFFTNGVLFSGLLPRYPEVKEAFGLSNTAFGFLVICFPIGAILAAAAAAPLIRAAGARAVTAIGTVLLAVILSFAGFAPSAVLFAAILLVAGLTDAIVDSAQNVQGVIVEQWRGRSIINSLHAIWSLGATSGGLIGTWCAANGVPLSVQLPVNGVVWAIVALVAAKLATAPGNRHASTEEAQDAELDEARPAATGIRPWRLLAPLVVLAICGTLLEEFANSWSALFIGRETDAPAGLAGLGFTIVLASQFVGRIVGDPMTDRWGREAVARAGGVVIAVGVLVAMIAPTYLVTFVGFALMGFGCATLVPAAFAAAARVPGLAHGTGIAILGWLMRLGFLLTSPVIGVISDAAGLRAALVVPLAAGLVAAVIAHRLATAARRPGQGAQTPAGEPR